MKDILEREKTDSRLEAVFFQHGLLEIYQRQSIAAKSKKIMEVFQFLIRNKDDASLATLSEIVTDTLREFDYQYLLKRYPSLERCLAQDGYLLNEEGELIPIISRTVEPAKEEGLVEALLDNYDFNVAKKCLEQAYDNYIDGNWEPANASLRSFLQDVFDQIALKLWPDEATKKNAGGERRKLLQEKGFIEGDTEAKLVSSFFTFASYSGSHPGISSESDCRLRRYMAVALASYYLEKFNEI